jgi:hypothetical protein
MSTNWKTRFRPTLDHLEARELLSANPVTVPVLPSGTALVQQARNRMQVNHGALLSDAAGSLAARQVNVRNGVADITQAARATLESDLLARLPRTLGTYPLIGEVKLDRVTLNRLTLSKDGNFNGQLTVTLKARAMSATVTAHLRNNQLSLDSDNALVRQFGKLDQRQREWQPKVTAALDALRARLMPQYFGSRAMAAGHHRR